MQTFKLKYKNRNPWTNNELRNDIKLRDNRDEENQKGNIIVTNLKYTKMTLQIYGI